ncbi:hypothetical protein FHY73_20120 [Bacillus tropicus]|nr:hypothetical protein FHY73_20120 [Bacillus tropicus]
MGDQLSINVRLVQLIISGGMNKTPLIKVSLYKVRGMRDGYILINRHVTCNCDCYFRGIMVEMACIY